MKPDITPGRQYSRRWFLRAVLATAAGLTAERTAEAMAYWAADVPLARPEGWARYPDSGWLEKSHPDRPALLDTDTGHQKYLEYYFLHEETVRNVLRKAYKDLLYPPVPKRRLTLGDELKKHIGYAQAVLSERYPVPFYYSPSLANAIHLAVATMAMVYSPYISIKNVKDLLQKDNIVVNHHGIPEDESFFWLTDIHEQVPHVFPGAPGACRPGWGYTCTLCGC